MRTVAIKTFDNYFSANIAITTLEANGVTAFLKDEYSATINPVYNNAIGGIKLLVAITDVANASNILLELEETYLQNANCPQCKQQGISSNIFIDKPTFTEKILAKFFANTPVTSQKIYQCQSCGWFSKILP
jgi:hypothetical protein